jgi:uncharacterized coiled-coil DUF342 family protein
MEISSIKSNFHDNNFFERIKEFKEAQLDATAEITELKAKICSVNESLEKVSKNLEARRKEAEECQLKVSKLCQCRDTIRAFCLTPTANIAAEVKKIESQVVAFLLHSLTK